VKGSLFIIIACLFWSVDALFRYPLIQKIGSWSIVQSEHLILSLLFLPFLFKKRNRILQASLADHFRFFALGFGGSALGTVCFTEAFYYLNPSIVILLQKYQVFITIILARIFLQERIQKRFIFWAIVSVIGAIGLGFPDLVDVFTKGELPSIFDDKKSLKGLFFTSLAVVFWGTATILGKSLSSLGYKNEEIMGMRFVYGLLGLFFVNYFFANLFDVFTVTGSYFHFLQNSNWGVWKLILLMVLLSGLLAMGFYYAGLRIISARLCSLMELFFPLCAIIVNWIYLGQHLAASQIVGAGLLILGATMVQIKRY